MDLTVLFPRQGLVAFHPVAISHERDSAVSVDIANRVMMAKQKFGSEVEFFDATGGWAAGARDIMVAAGYSPINVQYAAPSPDRSYKNMRAFIWWSSAEWVKNGGSLPPTPELIREGSLPQYSFVNGQMLMEPKEHVKERLGWSPNYWDSLANTFAMPDMPRDWRLKQADSQHAVTDFDPFRDEERERKVEFDPYRDSI